VSQHRETKNNHFLPRFLLSEFASGGKLHAYTRVDGGWSLNPNATPKKSGREKALYDQETEDWFEHHVESPAAPAVRRLVAGLSFAELSEQERFCVRNLVASQDLRTSKSDKILTPAFKEAAIRGANDLKRARLTMRDKGLRATKGQVRKARRTQTPKLESMGKQAWLNYIKSRVKYLRLLVRGLEVTATTAPNGSSFLTSDIGIVKFVRSFDSPAPHTIGLAFERDHWVMPLSPRRALLIHPASTPPIELASEEFVESINRRLILDAVAQVYSRGPVDQSLLPLATLAKTNQLNG
jgi:hypothetical protein